MEEAVRKPLQKHGPSQSTPQLPRRTKPSVKAKLRAGSMQSDKGVAEKDKKPSFKKA